MISDQRIARSKGISSTYLKGAAIAGMAAADNARTITAEERMLIYEKDKRYDRCFGAGFSEYKVEEVVTAVFVNRGKQGMYKNQAVTATSVVVDFSHNPQQKRTYQPVPILGLERRREELENKCTPKGFI